MTLRTAALLSTFLVSSFAHADKASLEKATARLRSLGTPARIAARAARHVQLGMPSAATRTKDDDYLLVRNGYVISYNAKRNAMNWASWEVANTDLGPIGRTERFRPDATLPKRFYVPNSGDYKIPGFSRGHMIRSGERTASERENAKTYVFPNMLPQAVNNNSGPWNDFEDFYRDQIKSGEYVAHVMAGGIFGKAPVAQRGVAVPSSTWKVVAFLKKGQRIEDIDDKTRVVSIVIPNNNEQVKVEQRWNQYRTSVADIEKQTGLSFFDSVAPERVQSVKSRVDDGSVPDPLAHEWTPRNWNDSGKARLQKVVATQVSGVVKWYDGNKKYGFITKADGTDVYVNAADRLTSLKAGETVTFDVGLNQDNKTFAMKVVSHAADAIPADQEPKTDTVEVEPKILATQVTGKVKFYDASKKFGFITLEDGSEVYVNEKARLTSIARGDTVTLDVGRNARNKTYAANVRSLAPGATMVLQAAVR